MVTFVTLVWDFFLGLNNVCFESNLILEKLC